MILFKTTPTHLEIIITWCYRKPFVSNVQINEPYFIFGLNDALLWEICAFGLPNLRRTIEPSTFGLLRRPSDYRADTDQSRFF